MATLAQTIQPPRSGVVDNVTPLDPDTASAAMQAHMIRTQNAIAHMLSG